MPGKVVLNSMVHRIETSHVIFDVDDLITELIAKFCFETCINSSLMDKLINHMLAKSRDLALIIKEKDLRTYCP